MAPTKGWVLPPHTQPAIQFYTRFCLHTQAFTFTLCYTTAEERTTLRTRRTLILHPRALLRCLRTAVCTPALHACAPHHWRLRFSHLFSPHAVRAPLLGILTRVIAHAHLHLVTHWPFHAAHTHFPHARCTLARIITSCLTLLVLISRAHLFARAHCTLTASTARRARLGPHTHPALPWLRTRDAVCRLRLQIYYPLVARSRRK